MVGVKKVNVCSCYYKLFYTAVTGDYGHIAIIITYQSLVCNKIALFLYYDSYAVCYLRKAFTGMTAA